MEQCHLGCGQQATYKTVKGKWLCDKNFNLCPAKRKRDSERKKNGGTGFQKGHGGYWLGKSSPNKGKTMDEAQRKKLSDALKSRMETKPFGILKLTKEQRSENGKKGGSISGGYRAGSGRGKSGRYNGIWCDSSWELAFVFWNLDHGKNISRCNKVFEYEFDGQKHKYHPDFEVDGTIVEIKGFWKPEGREKINQCSESITVIDKQSIQTYLQYIEDKVGKDFIRLYGE